LLNQALGGHRFGFGTHLRHLTQGLNWSVVEVINVLGSLCQALHQGSMVEFKVRLGGRHSVGFTTLELSGQLLSEILQLIVNKTLLHFQIVRLGSL